VENEVKLSDPHIIEAAAYAVIALAHLLQATA